ncbi:nucleoside triphosphate pyrophosphohydrolase [Berryella wangjianweii]|uniref:Nucleoside triphosphate pyrophosphohydrolase n=1 Tax=Berryella wangjianweii TaxID=2734634 RepID=A0A6M8J8V4_9ACTN|nr:MazG family protein [Berryella wangjianweii]QKF07819.1 nucleoside triphosphate pyrophosphohydrolase [Berryella wangjianweii]
MTQESCSEQQFRANDTISAAGGAFEGLVATIAALRAPDGCPWDRAQTHASIADNLIEEAYEAVDALERGDAAHMREELGDVLLQVVLQSQIAQDAGTFTVADVCADIDAKMIRRHPHVFGDRHADTASDVLDLWDQVKLSEEAGRAAQVADATAGDPDGAGEGAPISDADGASTAGAGTQPVAARAAGSQAAPSLLDSVPASFPALMQAQKVSRKAAAVGFEWACLDDVWTQVDEERAELAEAYAAAPKDERGKVLFEAPPGLSADQRARLQAQAQAAQEELGDLLFSLVNVGRHMGLNAEAALRASCAKFRARWARMEAAACAEGALLADLPTERMEELWRAAKAHEGGRGE